MFQDASSIWYRYWNVFCLIFKISLPAPIGTVCALLILGRIVSARAARSTLMHRAKRANTTFRGTNNNSISAAGATGGVSRNTIAMLLLTGIYFVISLPNFLVYALINLANVSCTMKFFGLLAAYFSTPVLALTIFTRVFDGVAFLVIPEFRAALINVLHCKFQTKAA